MRALLVLISLFVVAVALYACTYEKYDLPYARAGYDSFSHLGMIRTIQSDIDPAGHPLVEDCFPALYEGDTHLGPYLTSAALLSFSSWLSPRASLFIMAVFNIALLIWGLYFFFKRYSRDRLLALTGVALVLASTSLEILVKPQSLALADLLVTAHYPATFASGLMLLLLGLNVSFLDRPGLWLWFAQLVLAFLLITSHPLTGVMYAVALILLAIFGRRDGKAGWMRRLALVATLPAAAALASLWPFYSWWGSLSQSLSNGSGGYSPVAHNWEEILRILGLSLLGLPFLVRWRRLFLMLWCLACLAIAFSYLTPFQMPLYWRFAYMARIPLLLGLAWGITRDIPSIIKRQEFRRAVLVLSLTVFAAISLFYSASKVSDLAWGNKPFENITFLERFQGPEVVLLASPEYMYMAQGLYLFDVPTVTEGHAPQDIIGPRLEEVRVAEASLDPSLFDGLIREYRPRYVVAVGEGARDVALTVSGGEIVGEQGSLYIVEIVY